MPRPNRFLSLLLASSTLLACGGDNGHPDRGDARFAAMTDERREQSIAFALGTGALLPYLTMVTADGANSSDPACPARADDGATTTYTADDCTNASDGTRYDGRLVAVNAFSFGDVLGSHVDPAAPMSLEAEGWTANGFTLDGRLEQSLAQPADGQAYTATVDYTGALEAQTIALDETSACVGGGACTVDGFAVTPDGSFALEGELALGGDRPRGTLVMRGVDELRLDLDAIGADGCAPYTIDGQDAGQYCVTLPEPAPAIEIYGGGIGCSGVNGVYTMDLMPEVKGTPASLSVRVIDPVTGVEGEFVDFPELSYDAENDVHYYQRTVTQAESALADCSDRSAGYVYSITATTADGVSACASFGDHPELFPDCPAWGP